MGRATEELLAELHKVVATGLIAKLSSDEASAADMNAAIKFLKDNDITAEPEVGDSSSILSDDLEDEACGLPFTVIDGLKAVRG